MSVAGGLENALYSGKEINCTTVQIFTRNQRQWTQKKLEPTEILAWEKAKKETGIEVVMSHGSYLINLGSPDPENLAKSRNSFKEEIKRCHLLGVTYLNFHPGAATNSSEERCIATIIESLNECANLVSGGKTILLLEATAGQGSCVGHTFEQLGAIIKGLDKAIPIGVCIDTCHIFSAGYPISTLKDWEATLKEFDEKVGLNYLKALHVNDSLKPFGKRLDRHANLGQGLMGIDCFKVVMQHPLLRELPKYLETPEKTKLWKEEIELLRDFAK